MRPERGHGTLRDCYLGHKTDLPDSFRNLNCINISTSSAFALTGRKISIPSLCTLHFVDVRLDPSPFGLFDRETESSNLSANCTAIDFNS